MKFQALPAVNFSRVSHTTAPAKQLPESGHGPRTIVFLPSASARSLSNGIWILQCMDCSRTDIKSEP